MRSVKEANVIAVWLRQEESVLPTATPSDDEKDNDKDKGATTPAAQEEKPFELNNLKIKVEKGAFVAIVGRVGSGKVSLLFPTWLPLVMLRRFLL